MPIWFERTETELGEDLFEQVEKALRTWARVKSKEAGPPQVIMRTGFGLLS